MSITLKDIADYVAYEYWKEHMNNVEYVDQLNPYIRRFIDRMHKKQPSDETIDEFAQSIYVEVNRLIDIQKQSAYIQQQEETDEFNRAKRDLEQKALTHKNKQSLKQISQLKWMRGFTPEQINHLYNIYSDKWDEIHEEEQMIPSPKPKEKPIGERIKEFVILHPDELLTLDEFKEVIKDWNRKITDDVAYKFYQQKFFSLPGVTVDINEPKDTDKLGFKDKKKYIFGTRPFELNPDINHSITNYFPLKDNLKRYRLHKVAPRGTYMIDLMFNKKLVYLVAININTRYAMVELTNTVQSTLGNNPLTNTEGEVLKADSKTTYSYLRALNKMMNEAQEQNNPIVHLTGDGESAFTSRVAQSFYNENGITFHAVPRMKIEGKKGTDPLHTSLGLIDRLIRTIRDMLFNAKLPMTPKATKEMITQYNNAPHSTLSKWIGFEVSPLMIQQDKDKEKYIVMKINKTNLQTRMMYDFEIPIGSHVKVYNEKDTLGKRRVIARAGKVIGKQGVLYQVRTDMGIELIPRFKIDRL